MSSDIEITGLEELEATLTEMGPQLVRKALHDALDYAGSVLQEGQVVTAPILKGEHSPHPAGQLKQDIRRKIMLYPEDGIGVVAVGPSSHSFFGSFAEFGTSHQPARPWMRPAFEATQDVALDVFIEVIDAYISEYCKEHEGETK